MIPVLPVQLLLLTFVAAIAVGVVVVVVVVVPSLPSRITLHVFFLYSARQPVLVWPKNISGGMSASPVPWQCYDA